MNAKLLPVGFGKIHVVVVRSLLDIRECQSSIGLRHVDHLIKSCNSVADVLCVGQGLLALMWESKDAVRQVAARAELTMLLVRLPCRLDVGHCSVLLGGP